VEGVMRKEKSCKEEKEVVEGVMRKERIARKDKKRWKEL
jgi:hypothetical protein